MHLNAIIQTTRPAFLILTPICIFLGLALAVRTEVELNILSLILILIGGLSAHISVNMLNEYFDLKSGLDLQTNKTPFSGGSGALPEQPDAAPSVLIIGLLALFVTMLTGVYFIFTVGKDILPIGLIGVLLVVTYTQYINRSAIICLLAPGLGFGLLMVLGTELLLTGQISEKGILVALIPFFLINNLLLLNQYPDIDADKTIGRKTFPIVYGINRSNFVYGLFSLFAYGIIIVLVVNHRLPSLCLLAVFPFLLSMFSLYGAHKVGAVIGQTPQFLAMNVLTALSTPLLLGIGIIFG